MIALTPGDTGGIGLEITLKSWPILRHNIPFFLIADTKDITALAAQYSVPVQQITTPQQAAEIFKTSLPVLHHPFPAPARPGKAQPQNAPSIISAIKRAADLAMSGQVDAICTNPINKHALKQGAGFAFPGHTEFLGHLADVKTTVMLLTAPELSVVPVTIHIPVTQVAPALTPKLLETTINITHAAMQRDFGFKNPRIAVAGLNPHAGEAGTMGQEEITIIKPVLEKLKRQNMTLSGPHSADTMFHSQARQNYDVAICMYHDQALIPIKTLNFAAGVNVTLGLPFVRTSPDHGTAFDIAGKDQADPTSLVEAIKRAAKMAQSRKVFDANPS